MRRTSKRGKKVPNKICFANDRIWLPLNLDRCIAAPVKGFSSTYHLNESAATIKGRGAAQNPSNRFEKIHVEPDEDWNPEENGSLRTQFFRDITQTFITRNNSPDVGFETSINPYRGCEHGCIYCFARPTH